MKQQRRVSCTVIFLSLSLIVVANGSRKKVNKDHWGYYGHCSNTASIVIDSKWDSAATRTPKQVEERRTWLPKENALLRSSVKAHLNDGPRGGINWPVIANALGRTVRQCQARYFLNYAPINPQKSKEWTLDEHAIIWSIHCNVGNNWKLMAERLPGRTVHAVRNQYFKVVKKIPQDTLEQAIRGLKLNCLNTSSKVMETSSDSDSTESESPSPTPKTKPSTKTSTPSHSQHPQLDLTELSTFGTNGLEEFTSFEDSTIPELNFPWIDCSDKVLNDIQQNDVGGNWGNTFPELTNEP